MNEHEEPAVRPAADPPGQAAQKFARMLMTDNEALCIALEELEAHNQALAQELRSVRCDLEQANAMLTNLYVAAYQLHGTLERQQVLTAIQEIVVNLVGSEEFALYELDETSGAWGCAAAMGVDNPQATSADRAIRQALRTGTAHLPADDDSSVVACVPLKLDDRVTGYLAIFRLLSHKARLEPLDHELFDLLATHAATALYCTSLRDKVRSIAAGLTV